MNIRLLLVLLMMWGTLAVGVCQDYAPKPGETDIKLVIENKGTIWIKLHTKEAPKTTSRIIELVSQHFYDGQKFYRVLKTPKPFLIQTGDPMSRHRDVSDRSLGQNGTGQFIPYENSGFSNLKGAVGLSSLPTDRDKGDSQFFILLDDHPFLDGNYTVFGQVVFGMSVVNGIELGDRIASATIVRG